MANTNEIRGIKMTEAEIDEFLTEQGHGILCVASEGRAYAVPISIGYDGDQLFMYLITFGQDSKKLKYLQDTEEACVVAAEVNGRFDWRSVVVTGSTAEINDDEQQYHENVLDENGWFPSLFPPTEPMTDVTRIILQPTNMSGRKGGEYQD